MVNFRINLQHAVGSGRNAHILNYVLFAKSFVASVFVTNVLFKCEIVNAILVRLLLFT